MINCALNMKTLALIAIFLLAPIAVYSQCVATADDPCVAVHQSLLDRTAKALDLSKLKDDLIATYKQQGVLNDAERAAFQAALKATDAVIAAKDKAFTDLEHVNALQQKVIETFAALVEKLTAQINRPKSSWQKFLAILERMADIAAGIAIGHVL